MVSHTAGSGMHSHAEHGNEGCGCMGIPLVPTVPRGNAYRASVELWVSIKLS